MPVFDFQYDNRHKIGRLYRLGDKRKRLVLEFTLPKGHGAVEAEHVSWLWNIGQAPRWLTKQLKQKDEQAAKQAKKHKTRSTSTKGIGGGYVPGRSCLALGREHKWEDRGTYLKCVKCFATKHHSNVGSKTRQRVERL